MIAKRITIFLIVLSYAKIGSGLSLLYTFAVNQSNKEFFHYSMVNTPCNQILHSDIYLFSECADIQQTAFRSLAFNYRGVISFEVSQCLPILKDRLTCSKILQLASHDCRLTCDQQFNHVDLLSDTEIDDLIDLNFTTIFFHQLLSTVPLCEVEASSCQWEIMNPPPESVVNPFA